MKLQQRDFYYAITFAIIILVELLRWNKKAFFIIFRGLALKQIKSTFLKGESQTLNIPFLKHICWNFPHPTNTWNYMTLCIFLTVATPPTRSPESFWPHYSHSLRVMASWSLSLKQWNSQTRLKSCKIAKILEVIKITLLRLCKFTM